LRAVIWIALVLIATGALTTRLPWIEKHDSRERSISFVKK
jgi:hypothetical protein